MIHLRRLMLGLAGIALCFIVSLITPWIIVVAMVAALAYILGMLIIDIKEDI